MLWSGIGKAMTLSGSVQAVRNFRILPDAIEPLVGYALPIVEIVIGLLLILGLFSRIAAAIEALLMVAFIIGIISLWARGMRIDCGCFGGGGIDESVTSWTYLRHILLDGALLLAGAFVAWRPHSPLSLDRKLFPDLTDDNLDEDLTV